MNVVSNGYLGLSIGGATVPTHIVPHGNYNTHSLHQTTHLAPQQSYVSQFQNQHTHNLAQLQQIPQQGTVQSQTEAEDYEAKHVNAQDYTDISNDEIKDIVEEISTTCEETENGEESILDLENLEHEVSLSPAISAVLSGQVKERTPQIRKVCSTLRGGDGAILKFSEIFGPEDKIETAPPSRHKVKHTKNYPQREDEQQMFINMEEKVYLDEWEESEEEGSYQPVYPMKELSEIEEVGNVYGEVEEEMYENVMQRNWEENILWHLPSSSSPLPSPSPSLLNSPSSNTKLNHISGPFLVEEREEAQTGIFTESVSLWDKAASLPVVYNLDVKKEGSNSPWGATDRVKAALAANRAPPGEQEEQAPAEEKKQSIFPVLNEELLSSKWVEDIIWDEASQKRAKATPVIIDLNDRDMLFGDNLKCSIDEHHRVYSLQSNIHNSPIVTPSTSSFPRKRKHSEITPDTTSKELDKFNWSLDELYTSVSKTKVRQKNMGRALVQHSLPAIKLSCFRTHLEKEELQNFHRPRTKFPTKKRIKIVPVGGGSRSSSRSRKTGNVIRTQRALTGRDSRLVLMEYMEERPPLLMNVGMGTKILNYYRKRSSTDLPSQDMEDGETVMLEQSDESPFLGDIRPGHMVQSLENNMFRAPIVQHNVPTVDFLLIRSGGKAYIREISAIYAVGQEQPAIEVPAPNSRAANNYVKHRLKAFIYRLFKKRSTGQRLRIADILSAFRHSETSIRKRLKDCADFQRGGDDSGWWTVKKDFEIPSEEELRSIVTPENVCAYESMIAGQQRLFDCGIENVSNPQTTLPQIREDENDSLNPALEFLQEELLLTPWNITSNYISVMQGKGMFQLSGLGDPTGCGDGFSYMRVQKVQQTKKKKAPTQKHSVTGTDADLRKLTLDNSRKVLLNFGVSEEEINKLTRWDRIALVRQKSSAAAEAGLDPEKCKFARGSRHSAHQQQQLYQDECQDIFDRQLAFLQETDPDEDSDDVDDIPETVEVKDLADELESLLGEDTRKFNSNASRMLAMKKKRSRRGLTDAASEQEELEKFKKKWREDSKKVEIENIVPPSRKTFPTSVFHDTPSNFDNPIPTPNEEPPLKGKKVKRYVKYTTTKKRSDGTYEKIVKIVTDEKQMEELLAQKEALKNKRARRPKLTAEEEEERNQFRREKRRLQEKLRRLRKNKNRQKVFKERLDQGNYDGSLPNSNVQLTCGACGMIGHMRTNRNCPFYNEDYPKKPKPKPAKKPKREQQPSIKIKVEEPKQEKQEKQETQETQETQQPPLEKPLVKVQGTKITFAKQVLLKELASTNKTLPSSSSSASKTQTNRKKTQSPLVLRIKAQDLPKRVNRGNKRKRNSITEPNYMLHPPKKSRNRSYVNGRGAGVELANLLQVAWKKVAEHQFAPPFMRPVTVREAPDYYKVISNPMDLGTIQDKLRTYKYLSVKQFKADMKLIKDNCTTYNAIRNPHLPPMANLLYKICEDALKAMETELLFLDNAINSKKEEKNKEVAKEKESTISESKNL